MYDEIINSISYSIAFDNNSFVTSVLAFCNANSLPFFAILGVIVGVKFLKSAFSV